MVERVKQPKKKKPTDTEAKFRKEILKLMKDILVSVKTIQGNLIYICDDIKRNRG